MAVGTSDRTVALFQATDKDSQDGWTRRGGQTTATSARKKQPLLVSHIWGLRARQVPRATWNWVSHSAIFHTRDPRPRLEDSLIWRKTKKVGGSALPAIQELWSCSNEDSVDKCMDQ